MLRYPRSKIPQGDFELLVDAHSGKLNQFAARKTQNTEVAMELVQEVFLRLAKSDYRKIRSYVVPWMYRTCRNLIIDRARRRKRLVDDGQDIIAWETSSFIGPREKLMEQENAEMIRELLAKLNHTDSEILMLRYGSGLSYKEIASVLDISVSNVGFRIHQAMNRMRIFTKKKKGVIGS